VYGPTQCMCNGFGGDVQWNCATCPAAAPDDNDDCQGMMGLSCEYADVQCNCGFGGWNCNATCPQAQPQPGDPCMGLGNQPCNYGGTICVCLQNEFFCN